MIIVYSSISCALACGGNEACETGRYGRRFLCQRGWFLADNKDASPNKVNSFRPRYAKILMANLPKMVKPVIDVEVINGCTHRIGRGGWRERVSKEQLRCPGAPSRSIGSEVDPVRELRGNHNSISLRRRKSEWLVVVMTLGNAGRAKGLHRYYVCRIERRAA